MMNVQTRVLLPERFWEEARDQDHLKLLILQYLKSGYPGYVIKRVENGFAVCERRGQA